MLESLETFKIDYHKLKFKSINVKKIRYSCFVGFMQMHVRLKEMTWQAPCHV